MPPSEPSVCALLLAYDCESFVEEALQSALDQDYEPLDVLVSDDASRDGTVRVVEQTLERYRGPHRVRLQQRTSNSGSKSAHLNALAGQLSARDVIVLFDGDDVSSPRRVSRLVEELGPGREARAAYSAMSMIDREGRSLLPPSVPHPPAGVDSATWFAQVDAYAPGGTLALRGEVFERFGPIDEEIHEDVVLPFRASLLGQVRYVPEPLVTVRRHAGSFTSDPGRYRSLAEYRERMEAGITKAGRKAQSRLSDLAAVERSAPDRARELEELRNVVVESLRRTEETRELLSRRLWRRLRAFARVVRSGAYPEQLEQHALMALSPALYVRYKRAHIARTVR